MRKILGRKKAISEESWKYAASHIEELVTREELMDETEKAVENIKEVTRGKRVAFAWSGGKDSIVLADICKKAGVESCVFGHTDLEYPVFLKWCLEHLPEKCEVINTHQDLDWLAKHPDMIFPKGDKVSRWYTIVQRKACKEYYFKHDLEMLIVGRRTADGNVVGENGFLYKRSGEVVWAPLAQWSHELIFAYLHYCGLEIPPIYEWKDGYKCGTHPWPSRMGMESIEQGYREVYDIDPTIVINAAEKIESAREFLRRNNYAH